MLHPKDVKINTIERCAESFTLVNSTWSHRVCTAVEPSRIENSQLSRLAAYQTAKEIAQLGEFEINAGTEQGGP